MGRLGAGTMALRRGSVCPMLAVVFTGLACQGGADLRPLAGYELSRGAGRFRRWLGCVGPKGQCDQEGANTHAPRTDVEPSVTGERVVDQTPSQRTSRHAQTTSHCCSTDDR